MRIIGIGLLAIVGLGALFAGMTFLGTPASCVGREATTEDRQVMASWEALVRQAAAGGHTTLAVSEAQANALVARSLAGQGLPVSDVAVRFCPDGQAEVAGRVTLLGWSVNALARAAVDASTGAPEARVTSLRVGALPGALTNGLTGLVLGGASRALPLPPGATIRIEDGRAVVTGTLRP